MLVGKRLFPIWALLAVATLIFVYCGGSDEPTEPPDPLAGAALCLSDDFCGVCPEGDSSTVIEVANCGNSTVLNWTATETSDWFNLSVASGTTPDSFTVEADINRTIGARTDYVIVTVEGLAGAPETVWVAQPNYGAILHVSSEEWSAAAACDTSDAVVVTNTGNASILLWSAVSDSSWLTMVPAEGVTPGEFEIIADSNRSGLERSGAVQVTAAGLTDSPVTITVTQPTLEPVLCVSISEWQPSAAGEEAEILVTNSGNDVPLDWVVTENADWLSLSAAGGSTPGGFTITAEANLTEEPRAGSVTVTSDGLAGSPWDITVNQECVFAHIGSYNTPGAAFSVFVTGDYAYVAVGLNGLCIVDLSDPSAPDLAGALDTDGYATCVFVSGDYAYLGDGGDGLQIINISDPSDPTLTAGYATLGWPDDIFVSGNYAFVAESSEGLEVVDITDPANPTVVTNYPTDGNAVGVFVSGDHAYVAATSHGLDIIDVTNPTTPTLVGNYDTPDWAYDIFVSGDYAYVADGEDGGLQIIDVSDPTSPAWSGSFDTPGEALCVFVSGNYAYLGDKENGLYIINVVDPFNPTLIGVFDPTQYMKDIFVVDEYAIVTHTNGLEILKLGL